MVSRRSIDIESQRSSIDAYHLRKNQESQRSSVDAYHLRRESQRSIEKCKTKSRQVRIYISFLFFMYTLTSVANVTITIYNIFGNIPYVSKRLDANAVSIMCIVVPRLIFTLVCWATFAVFLIPLALNYKVEPDLWLPDFMPEDKYPTVDVLLPRYMENWELYKPTVHAVLTINYPKEKIRVHVCDDGFRTDPVGDRVNAAFPGAVRYVTRPDGKHAKAGNLNNALKDAIGDLVVVFDADMNAHPDYLLRTVPHLLTKTDDGQWTLQKIAFVQTIQAFYNSDKPLFTILDGCNSVFYKLMMPAFNGMGCAFCVGTNYTMQRAALNSVGGFFTDCAVEDVFTAMILHEAGWTSKFTIKKLASGLSPETMGEFFAQRRRWISGNAQMVVYFNPMTRNLSFMKKMAYLSANWFMLIIPLVMLLGVIRMALWATNNIIIGSRATTMAVPFIIETVPLFLIFLFLPIITIVEKLCALMTVFFNIHIYLVVINELLHGRLNPRKCSYRVKASSEALGAGFPMLALINIVFVVIVVAMCIAMMLPQTEVIHGSWDYVVIATFVGLTLCWNFAILYVIGQSCVNVWSSTE